MNYLPQLTLTLDLLISASQEATSTQHSIIFLNSYLFTFFSSLQFKYNLHTLKLQGSFFSSAVLGFELCTRLLGRYSTT
jgi:hypothetical protein